MTKRRPVELNLNPTVIATLGIVIIWVSVHSLGEYAAPMFTGIVAEVAVMTVAV
jgi:hypothetical protein